MTELLDLEQLDRDLYRGVNDVKVNGEPALYGGQVAAQALKAAGLTVATDRAPHSLHGYFLRPGLPAQPVIFAVERDRDGRSFSARRVRAMQNGAVIFEMTASFHIDEAGGTYEMPIRDGLIDPESCVPEPHSANFPRADARVVPPTQVDDAGNHYSSTVWLRAVDPLGDDRLTHCCALTYLSDIGSGFMTLDRTDLPRGGPSLDHSMWFHGAIRADAWTLLHMWPLMAGGARGLYAGSMHQQDGQLGAMVTQEILLRRRP
ncbi:MAG: acyl-CoA thioesterase [Acidimicrobiales bacterium]|nr:acyl-CoA thioesterase [Acidimicrobiales bacterium]